VPTQVQLELETSDHVNLDERGRSLPTQVRIYQLSQLGRLQQANFEDIWDRAKDALAETLVESQEVTIYPGQVMVHRFKRNDSADYVAAVAVFRTPIGDAWRTVQEWPLPGDPCQAKDDEHAAPKLEQLRVRLFLEDERIESVNNYRGFPRRSCLAAGSGCAELTAPNELPNARRNRRLRTFEDDPREPQATMQNEANQP
jgi:type VI secretion system protein VasD